MAFFAEFDAVLQFNEYEGVVVEVFVDLRLVDQVREELLEVSLSRNKHEDGGGALSGVVVHDDVEIVDLGDELLAALFGEPEQKLVDHQHDAAEALRLGVFGHALEPLAPARVDTRVGDVATLVLEPGAREALLALDRACGDGLEVLAPADDPLGLEPFPDDVAVLLPLAPDLVEDRIDVEKLEGLLAAPLERPR